MIEPPVTRPQEFPPQTGRDPFMSEKKLAVSDPRAVAFCDAIRGMAPENRERLLCAMEGHLKAQSLQAHSNARLWLLVARAMVESGVWPWIWGGRLKAVEMSAENLRVEVGNQQKEHLHHEQA